MSDENAVTTLKWILDTVLERNDEAQKVYEQDRGDQFNSGRALAYTEMLDIIKDRISVFED